MRQSWTKSCRQIHKIKQNRFFYGLFYSWFFATFYQKTSNFCFWVDGWVLAMKSKYFMNFLKISEFPKILSHKSFSKLWGNMWHLWWRQIVLKSEKSANVLSRTVVEVKSTIGPEISFLSFSQVCSFSFPWYCSLGQYLTISCRDNI